MAAMVASQHAGLWQQQQQQQQQRRSSQHMHMSPMGMSTMIPTSGPPTSRPYQSNQIELSMPMFPNTTMGNSMNFQPGAYGFDLSAMNHFPVQQQPINFSFQPAMQHPSTFPQTTHDLTQTAPIITSIPRHSISSLHRSPSVKSEPSPIEPSRVSFNASPVQEPKTNASGEQTDSPGGIAFSTDVDCLMKAIQQKSQTTPAPAAAAAPAIVAAPAPPPPEIKVVKARKRYQCSMPNCNKSFYQKTHLEIHTRAHTGVKPFVSNSLSFVKKYDANKQ
jgi:hypothetical protein